MNLLPFRNGTWKIWQAFSSIISFMSDRFDYASDDIVLRMLILTKPYFIETMPMDDILTPLNPLWFIKAGIWRMEH